MKYSLSGRDMSLVEQKKLQWAKEKEELAKLNEFFSSTTMTTSTSRQFERTSIRTYYSNGDLTTASTSSSNSNTLPRQPNRLNETFNLHKNAINYNGNTMIVTNNRHHDTGRSRAYGVADFYSDNNGHYHANDNGNFANDSTKQFYKENVRSPILPPIERNTIRGPNQLRMNPHTDEDTSGYLSDLSNFVYPSSADELTNNLNGMRMDDLNKCETRSRQHANDDIEYNEPDTIFSMPKTPTSMSSDNHSYVALSGHPLYRKEKEERAKWGDRNSHLYDSISKESSIKSDGPIWLERSLADSGDESVKSYSFIRGQNAPIDPNILAERTTKRLKALEFQNAIKAQVEERERQRKIEHEQLLAEESRHETSMRQQIESNERRIEEEQRKIRERIEKEQRKQEMMRLAIEKARQAAEIEKSKRKRSFQCNDIDEYCDQQQNNCKQQQQQQQNANDAQRQSDRWTNPDTHYDLQKTSTSSMESRETDSSDNANSFDDGEQILIGTPIRMKKKTLNKPPKMVNQSKEIVHTNEFDKPPIKQTTVTDNNNIDGIALVLQTLPPIMPILSDDIINLNQNINNLNTSNIQLAVMLAHLQQLNSIAQTQLPDISRTTTKINPNPTKSHEKLYRLSPAHHSNGDNENGHVSTSQPDINSNNQDNLCEQCNQSPVKLLNQNENPIVFDGINDSKIQMANKMNMATITNDSNAIDAFTQNHVNPKEVETETKIVDNDNINVNAADNNQSIAENLPNNLIIKQIPTTLDVSTQTDKKLEVEYCFQCRYHQCHHHHVIVKDLAFNCGDDIKTVAINHHSNPTKQIKCIEKDCTTFNQRNDCNQTNVDPDPDPDPDTSSDTFTINKDAIKSASASASTIKIENRPKWGVNRPLQQYVKASERDPFYLRNKRKKHRKRQIDQIIDIDKSSDDINDGNDMEIKDGDSRSTSPSPSIITNSTVTLSSPLNKSNQRKRSICTEILPIKTDMNGRVYLNFREASLIMSEDDTRQTIKTNNKPHRIMNRCRTMNDIHCETFDVTNQKNSIE